MGGSIVDVKFGDESKVGSTGSSSDVVWKNFKSQWPASNSSVRKVLLLIYKGGIN